MSQILSKKKKNFWHRYLTIQVNTNFNMNLQQGLSVNKHFLKLILKLSHHPSPYKTPYFNFALLWKNLTTCLFGKKRQKELLEK